MNIKYSCVNFRLNRSAYGNERNSSVKNVVRYSIMNVLIR